MWITESIQSSNRPRVYVNTFIHCTTIIVMIVRHQVTIVLSGPACMTLGLGRHHQYTASGGYIAHCTGDIVAVELRQRWHSIKPVLNRGHEILVGHSTDVLEIVRIIWHAEMVGCPSFMIISCPPSSS
ncbi:hypothetical protein GBAR_LOCUS23918 [Geodia barretti]|uniref:Uncharacterized protein n=1 Tax=Geodia barretti TaxID=519541 RepID=A0AA35X3T2_GEOBA|nr:hypothetical protein GBAR_LOCUS23918 [Geodia barretti]